MTRGRQETNGTSDTQEEESKMKLLFRCAGMAGAGCS